MTVQMAGLERQLERRDADPFAHFSLDTLVSATARLRPDSLAFHDRAHMLPYGILAVQVAAFARQLNDAGLKPGERILIAGGAEIAALIALVAAVRGGYEPALAPLDLSVDGLSSYARAVDAAAIVGPGRFGDVSPAEVLLRTAASVTSIRLVASYGEGFDGAIDLSAAACLRYAAAFPDEGLERARSAPAAPPRIITADRSRNFAPVLHHQSTLMAAALDIAARAKIGRETPILCTLPPTTFAGLVLGPFAALLSGTALHLHGPFDARDFLQTRDKLAAPHLVMPIEIAQDMVQANVMMAPASAILVSRRTANEALRLPEVIEAGCPLVDLYAIDEAAAIAEERRGGTPRPPAQEPHFIGFDDARILAVAAMPAMGNGLALQGAAVSAG